MHHIMNMCYFISYFVKCLLCLTHAALTLSRFYTVAVFFLILFENCGFFASFIHEMSNWPIESFMIFKNESKVECQVFVVWILRVVSRGCFYFRTKKRHDNFRTKIFKFGQDFGIFGHSGFVNFSAKNVMNAVLSDTVIQSNLTLRNC